MKFFNFNVPINEISIIAFLIICLVSYYLLFKEHHKNNKLKFSEIYPLVINYLVLCIVSFIVLLFGIDRVLIGYEYNEEIYEVIKEFITGFSIISVVIINFIFYVKSHKVNPEPEERKVQEDKTEKIAEIVELVFLLLMIIAPIFNIFRYINFVEKEELIKQSLLGLLFICVSVFLLFNLNPLDIKGKLKKMINKKENKEKENKKKDNKEKNNVNNKDDKKLDKE